jgi:predicted phosphodiesterase
MSKILIISDVHFTTYFNRKKLEFFKELIPQFDQIIINGDFWSYYSVTFDQFINSRWKELFPLFKAKNTIYIYGNHDQERWIDERANLFSVKQVREYRFRCGDKVYIVTHGDKILGAPSFDSDRFTRVWRTLYMDAPHYALETLLLKIFGVRLYRIARRLNKKIKKYSSLLGDNKYLITGHTHLAEIDLKNHFINTGFIHSGVASYIVLQDCEPKVVNERYDWGIL